MLLFPAAGKQLLKRLCKRPAEETNDFAVPSAQSLEAFTLGRKVD